MPAAPGRAWPSGARPAAATTASRYARATSSPCRVISGLPDPATGICDSGPRLAISSSISASTGGMTWAPSLR